MRATAAGWARDAATGAVEALVGLVERTRAGADSLLPNALAALHNCTLVAEALPRIARIRSLRSGSC